MADRRIPLRIGAVLAGLVLARAVPFFVDRMGTGGPSGNQLPRPSAGTGILVAVYTLLGAAIAVLVTLRRDEYWVRAADGSGFPTRSILGWETTPILAEVAVAIVGAAGGALLGLLVFRRYRRLGPHVAMTAARDSS
jgi:hypothetical protein